MSNQIEENLRTIRENISAACSKADRSPTEISIIAATKSQSLEKIQVAISSGISICGENYLQEAEKKISEIGRGVQWHFIGHLQSNKAKKAVELFDCIQTLDSEKLARKIDSAVNSPYPIFIEVNIGAEESKFGIPPENIPSFCKDIKNFPNLSVRGLFCMAPFLPAERVRPFFQKMRQLAQQCSLKELSMGMSNDYAVAVEEGSTMVRLGTVLFGKRQT